MRTRARVSATPVGRRASGGLPVLTILALALLAAPAAASWPGANGQIAYGCVAPVGLCAINPDGTGRRTLVAASPPDFGVNSPAWSPDGNRVVFVGGSGPPRPIDSDLWIVDADGANARPLVTEGGEQREPAFSPDGKQIVFWSSRDLSVSPLWIVNVDGSGLRPIPGLAFYGGNPVWRRSGEIVYTEGVIGSGSSPPRLMGVQPDGSGLREIRPPESAQADISPDDLRVIYTAMGGSDLYVASLDGSNATPVTATTQFGENFPAFSPDGAQFATTRKRNSRLAASAGMGRGGSSRS